MYNTEHPPKTDDRLLTLYEVRTYLRVSMVSIYSWVRDGKLPAIRVGKDWRVKQSDLDAWMEGQRNVEASA